MYIVLLKHSPQYYILYYIMINDGLYTVLTFIIPILRYNITWWIMEEYIAELELLLIKHLGKAEKTGHWVDYVKVKYRFYYEWYCKYTYYKW